MNNGKLCQSRTLNGFILSGASRMLFDGLLCYLSGKTEKEGELGDYKLFGFAP